MPRTEYVLIYCHSLLFSDMVLVLRKSKPEWQKGLINLPGGKIEKGENIWDAAVRELREETGYVSTTPIQVLGKIHDGDAVIHCCRATVEDITLPDAVIDEKPYWMNWKFLSKMDRLIPNLRVIIPLLSTGVSDWIIEDNYRAEPVYSHKITISLRTYKSG